MCHVQYLKLRRKPICLILLEVFPPLVLAACWKLLKIWGCLHHLYLLVCIVAGCRQKSSFEASLL